MFENSVAPASNPQIEQEVTTKLIQDMEISDILGFEAGQLPQVKVMLIPSKQASLFAHADPALSSNLFQDKLKNLKLLGGLSRINLISTLTGCPIQAASFEPDQAKEVPKTTKIDANENIVVKVVKEPVRLRDIARQDDDDENFISLRNQFNPAKKQKTQPVPLREPQQVPTDDPETDAPKQESKWASIYG